MVTNEAQLEAVQDSTSAVMSPRKYSRRQSQDDTLLRYGKFTQLARAVNVGSSSNELEMQQITPI